MTKATKLSKPLFVRRYIDDILLISESNTVSVEIIKDINKSFIEYDLDLTLTTMSAENGVDKLLFLDIEHILLEQTKKFFYTRNFAKATPITILF